MYDVSRALTVEAQSRVFVITWTRFDFSILNIFVKGPFVGQACSVSDRTSDIWVKLDPNIGGSA